MSPKARNRSYKAARQKAPGGEHMSTSTHPSPEDTDTSSNTCSICAEEASDWAVGACSHVICGDCSHRMRVLYDRKACVMCNEMLRQVALVPVRHYRNDMTFEDAVALQGAFHDKQVDIWFIDRSRQQQLRCVRGFKCSNRACANLPPQETVFANATQLRAHARSTHRAIYCEICFPGKKMFVSEMPQYPLDNDRTYSSKLRGHLRKEHPQCKFCRRYYLDDEKLYAHLQERHETCSICERNGRMHEYYANFRQLENHYAKEHYICSHDSCRGVVFSTKLELQAHEHRIHGEPGRAGRSRAFRVDLSELHGSRDARRPSSTPQDVERERERQAARRRAFLSSSVVFSGALTIDDSVEDPLPNELEESQPAQSSDQPPSIASQSAPATSGVSGRDAIPIRRRPDDGRFHPFDLPRNREELQARNTILVRSMRSLLDPAAYEQFKRSSGQFQTGDTSADEFFDAAVDAFGLRTAVRDILPELAALLPSHLLREPLLRTCFRRTNTRPEEVGYLGLGNTTSSSPPIEAREEQFPSLGRTPVPRRPLANVRRFGAPGPEEFPRLNRVNGPNQTAEADQSATQEVSARASYANASSSVVRAPNAGSTHQTRTAASAVKRKPQMQRIFGTQSAAGAAPGNASSEARLRKSAFPALGSANSSLRSTVNDNNNLSDSGQLATQQNSVPADVSMRVGAVWGGAAARAHDRSGRKRGPGTAQRRRPASPPKSVELNASDFPNIRGISNSALEISGSAAQSDAPLGEPSSAKVSQGTPRKSRVIDVVEISRARQRAASKSNLPKIGGSGYGFAWDRKKVQKKKREIKEGASESQRKGADSTSQRGAPLGLTNEKPESGSIGSDAISVSSSRVAIVTPDNVADDIKDLTTDETDMTPSADKAGEPSSFDPYSYLKSDTGADDMVASFLSGSK